LLDVLDKWSDEEPSQRLALFQQTTSATRRDDADWLAALASDVIPSSAFNQLQIPRRNYYYGNLRSVICRTNADHLHRAVFVPWDYADPLENQSLHLDPSEDRRHAHQWNKPTADPDRKKSGGMLGANRLAIEALALFTSLPNGDALRTIGFTGQRSYNTRWTWPIWDVPIGLSCIRSILTLAELQDEIVSADTRDRLHRRGIVTAFRIARILVEKTRNFTPADCVA
jgi:hypothetical protein